MISVTQYSIFPHIIMFGVTVNTLNTTQIWWIWTYTDTAFYSAQWRIVTLEEQHNGMVWNNLKNKFLHNCHIMVGHRFSSLLYISGVISVQFCCIFTWNVLEIKRRETETCSMMFIFLTKLIVWLSFHMSNLQSKKLSPSLVYSVLVIVDMILIIFND